MAKKSKKSKKLDRDGLPSYIPKPTERELILSHQIATTEKEIHDDDIEGKILDEKIAILDLQLVEAKEEKQRLIKRMKRQADAYRRFLKHGAKGKWKEGEVVNLGEGLRVTAKKPHVTKGDVAEAKEAAKNKRLAMEEGMAETKEKESAVDFELEERKRKIEERKSYRDAGSAIDAAEITELENRLVVEDDYCREAALIAEKVVGQSIREVKEHAEEAKRTAVKEARKEMNRRKGKGVHRLEERDHDWLLRTSSVYRAASSSLEAEVAELEKENLRLVHEIVRAKTEAEDLDDLLRVPSWKFQVGEDDVRDGRTTPSKMALVLSRPSSTAKVVSSRRRMTTTTTMTSVSSHFPSAGDEIERLFHRTPSLRNEALPLYRKLSLELVEAEEKRAGNSHSHQIVDRAVRKWQNRIDTPDHVPKALDFDRAISSDVSRPASSGLVLWKNAYLESIADHLFTDAESQAEEKEKRRKLERSLRALGTAVNLHPCYSMELEKSPSNASSSFYSKFERQKTVDVSSSLPRITTTMVPDSAGDYFVRFGPCWPAVSSTSKFGAEDSGLRWPIDANTMKKVLRLPLVKLSGDDDELD